MPPSIPTQPHSSTLPPGSVSQAAARLLDVFDQLTVQEVCTPDGRILHALCVPPSASPVTDAVADRLFSTLTPPEEDPGALLDANTAKVDQLLIDYPLTYLATRYNGQASYVLAQHLGYSEAVPLQTPRPTTISNQWQCIGGVVTQRLVINTEPNTQIESKRNVRIPTVTLTADGPGVFGIMFKMDALTRIISSGEWVFLPAPGLTTGDNPGRHFAPLCTMAADRSMNDITLTLPTNNSPLPVPSGPSGTLLPPA